MPTTKVKGKLWRITEHEGIYAIETKDKVSAPWKRQVTKTDLDEAIKDMGLHIQYKSSEELEVSSDFTLPYSERTLVKGNTWRIVRTSTQKPPYTTSEYTFYVQHRPSKSLAWTSPNITIIGAYTTIDSAVKCVAEKLRNAEAAEA